MATDKKNYDKKRYLILRAGQLGLDLDDPDLEKKVYRQKPSTKKLDKLEIGLIGVERATLLSHKKFDRYFKNWCIKNNRMVDYEIYKKKQQI